VPAPLDQSVRVVSLHLCLSRNPSEPLTVIGALTPDGEIGENGTRDQGLAFGHQRDDRHQTGTWNPRTGRNRTFPQPPRTLDPMAPSGYRSALSLPSLRSRIGKMLDRYGFRPGREVTVRLNALEGAIERIDADEVPSANVELPTVLNGSLGSLVVSRYRPTFIRASIDPAVSPQILESVHSDVGPLVFPAFDRFMLPHIRNVGAWEADESAHLRATLRPGMKVLDIGANVGYMALVMAEAVGDDGFVIALEPEPLNFELLCHNLRRNGATNVVPVHSAAGERTGTITLQRSPDNAGDHRTAPHPVGIAPLDVPLVAIDDLLGPDQVVDFVLIDAQGYDHRVVQGMAETIKRCRPRMLIEFWPIGILGLGEDPDEVLDQYRSLGYRIHLLPDKDVSHLGAEEILTHTTGKHVNLSLSPA
jgi:FkbM family methyltransferase